MTQPVSYCLWCRWLPVFVIGLIAGAAVLTWMVKNIPSPQLPLSVASTQPISDWVLFRDRESGIEFRHPPTWKVDISREFLNILDEEKQLIISIEPEVNTAEFISNGCSVFIEERCEIAHYNTLIYEIDWGEGEGASVTAYTRRSEKSGVRITLLSPTVENKSVFRNFLTKFVFL